MYRFIAGWIPSLFWITWSSWHDVRIWMLFVRLTRIVFCVTLYIFSCNACSTPASCPRIFLCTKTLFVPKHFFAWSSICKWFAEMLQSTTFRCSWISTRKWIKIDTPKEWINQNGFDVKKKIYAPAGNRTRVCTVAGYYSTTRPLVPDAVSLLRSFISKHRSLYWCMFNC